MKFLDQVKIFIKSGDGGNGSAAFRREKFIEYGGPDGGNGGKGGNIIIEAVTNLNTLIDFRYKQHFKARKGGDGSGRNRSGADADDIIIKVPVGTQIFDEEYENMIVDMDTPHKTYFLAKGGDGGKGNAHYKSSTNRSPTRADHGYSGEEKWLWLRLKLIADAGIIGLPNAGKSTFLSSISHAKPKVADYPFTTLHPELGVVYIDEREFTLADIPGLIEGASDGAGLGTRFLGHVERTGVLLHLIDATQENVIQSYKTIRQELQLYGGILATKTEIIALNKIDALTEEEFLAKQKELEDYTKNKVYLVSAVSKQGTKEIIRELWKHIQEYRIHEEEINNPNNIQKSWSPV